MPRLLSLAPRIPIVLFLPPLPTLAIVLSRSVLRQELVKRRPCRGHVFSGWSLGQPRIGNCIRTLRSKESRSCMLGRVGPREPTVGRPPIGQEGGGAENGR